MIEKLKALEQKWRGHAEILSEREGRQLEDCADDLSTLLSELEQDAGRQTALFYPPPIVEAETTPDTTQENR